MQDRVACVHADRCGGCPAIDLAYDDQLARKHARVTGALARYASLDRASAAPVIAAERLTEYRTRAKLVASQDGSIGLFAKGGSHDVVDIPQCRVIPPVIARAVAFVRARAKRGELVLRAIDVREVSGGALLTLVVERDGDMDSLRAVARELMAENSALIGVAASLHDGTSPQVLGNETIVLAGEQEAEDRIGRALQLATFGSFVQAHREQAARVHDLVAESIGISETTPLRVLDLYAGSGAIALTLAARGADVTCVEAFGPAATRITRASERARANVRAIHADAASALGELARRGERFDAVIVNPPRRGVSPDARDHVARLGAPVIAYVSCDPDTLARDLDHLARLGYRCHAIRPLDMIPLTEEVETVALLRRDAPRAPRVLYEDETAIFVEKSAHETTTPRSDDGLAARVRLLPNAEGAVCVQRLDRGTSGVVVYARDEKAAELWRSASTAPTARRVFLAAARGIVSAKGNLAPSSMQNTRIKFRRVAIFAKHSVLRVILGGEDDGGRTDLVRQRLAAIAHPVIGDERFGHALTNRHFEEKYGLDRTFLHCVRVELDHPRTHARLVIESPVPGDLATVLERAGGPNTLRALDEKDALGRSSPKD